MVAQKLVIHEHSLKQLTHTTARLIRRSDVPAVYGRGIGSSMFKNDCETVVYRDGKRLHVTRPGESLGFISHRYGVTEEQLKKWNNLKSQPYPLSELPIYPKEGQTLIVGDE